MKKHKLNYFKFILPAMSVGILLFAFIFSMTFVNSEKGFEFSPELQIDFISPFAKLKGKIVAASCGFGTHGSSDEYSSCTRQVNCCYGGPVNVTGTSQCGGACTGGTPACANHPSMGQPCVSAPNGCGVTATGTYDSCGICNGTPPAVPSCSLTNVCGQSFTGSICGGVCNAGGGADSVNNSCIGNFKVTADTINPNGSVEFSWTIPSVANVSSKCGFVDLTTPTPRLIPGLQNLDPSVDKARITNIQTTTRFCLVCQFYSLIDNSILGDAVVHQWVRVIRIGEN